MPFKSEAQRRKFYAMANRGEISRGTVKEWEDATPKGKKLPEKVKRAYVLGSAAALDKLGLKSAAEELRLKIPDRTFHGFDAARKAEANRANKKADCAPGAEDSNDLEKMLEEIDEPISPNTQLSTRDPLDRATAWGAPSNLSAGDTASRLGDMGQPTAVGTVF